MAANAVTPANLLPVTIADTVPVDTAWTTCGGIGSCLLGRVELNLRNIALLASIVASVAGTILTYGAGNLYLAAHFAVCAVVSVYTFFAMKDYELIGELSSALDRVKTQHQTLERQTQAMATTAAGLETTNAHLAERNTEFEERVADLEQTNTHLGETNVQIQGRVQELTTQITSLEQTKSHLEATRDQLHDSVEQLGQRIHMIDEGGKIYAENTRRIADTSAELEKVKANLDFVRTQLQKEVDRFQAQNTILAGHVSRVHNTSQSVLGNPSSAASSPSRVLAPSTAHPFGSSTTPVPPPAVSSPSTNGAIPRKPDDVAIVLTGGTNDTTHEDE